MDTRASYVTVGAFVLVLLVGLLAFVLWFANFRTDVAYDQYEIRFEESVAGLRSGTTVSYRGIPVGEVRNVFIDPDNMERVVATIRVDADTPIKTDTVATLEMQSITGGVIVMLSGGTAQAPRLARVDDAPLPVIRSRPSQLDRLMEGAPALVERVDMLVNRAIMLLDDENRDAFASTLANLERFSGALGQQAPQLEDSLARASTTLDSLERVAGSMARIAALLEEDAGPLMSDARGAMAGLNKAVGTADATFAQTGETLARFEGAAGELEALVAENRRPIYDFTNTTLYDAATLMAEFRELVVSLNRLAVDVGRDPGGFIFRGHRGVRTE